MDKRVVVVIPAYNEERTITGVIRGLNRQGLTIVVVTHEPDVAEYAQRVVTFRDGAILGDAQRRAA